MAKDASETAGSPAYRMRLWRKGERFYLEIPELSLRVHDADLKAAYDKMEESREAALKEYREAGAEEPRPSPRGDEDREVRPRRTVSSATPRPPEQPGFAGLSSSSGVSWQAMQPGFWSQVALSTVKAAFVGIVILFALILGLNYALQSFDRTLVEDLASRAYRNVHVAAERLRNANPEARETLREDLRTLARELKPLVDELRRPAEAPPSETE